MPNKCGRLNIDAGFAANRIPWFGYTKFDLGQSPSKSADATKYCRNLAVFAVKVEWCLWKKKCQMVMQTSFKRRELRKNPPKIAGNSSPISAHSHHSQCMTTIHSFNGELYERCLLWRCVSLLCMTIGAISHCPHACAKYWQIAREKGATRV